MTNSVAENRSFRKNALTVALGTGLAQVIPVAAAPVLARLYSPADVGVFALLIAVASVLVIFGTGRLEMAILLPKDDGEARSVRIAALSLAATTTVVVVLVILFAGKELCIVSGYEALLPHLWILPGLVFLWCLYNIYNSWLVRLGRFRLLSGSKVLNSGGKLGGQIALHARGGQGLLIGTLLGYGAALALILVGGLCWCVRKADVRGTFSIRAAISRYRRFPLFSLPADLLNTVVQQIPIFCLGAWFGSEATGHLGMCQRIFAIPMMLLADSLLEVFRHRVSGEYARTGQCRSTYLMVFKYLVVLGLPIFTVMFFWGDDLFSLVLGERWRIAGEFAQIMALFYLMRFIAAPLSCLFYIAEKQKTDLCWQVGFLLVSGVAMMLGHYLGSLRGALWAYAIGGGSMYIINALLSYRFSLGQGNTE